jgi:hypothetical protein
VIPGEVVEAAVAQCEDTLNANADATPDAIRKMIEAFGEFGVAKEQIEARCQCRAEAIRPAQLVQLRKIYASLKDGMSAANDWFPEAMPQRSQALERPRGGAPIDKLDEFERRHGESVHAEQVETRHTRRVEDAPATAAVYREPERDSQPMAKPETPAPVSGPVETGGHDNWLDNFNALAPREDHQGEPDWYTYADGAVYLIGQATKDDLARLKIATHQHLSVLREANNDLYRRITQAITERGKALAAGAKAA